MQNELDKSKSTGVILVSVILAALIIIGTCVAIKLHRKEDDKPVPPSTTETSTEATEYTVDLAYIERMIKEERFTDKFETYTANSFPTSSTASKEAYWKGIQEGKTVNPLLLAATSSYLSDLGLKTPSVKPSELYTDDGKLNAKGVETLEAVKKVIFSSDVDVLTIDLGSTAGKYYNSTPSKSDGGIEYAKKVGIKGNTVAWVITTKRVDVDAGFDDIVEKDQKKGEGEKATTKAAKTESKQLIQLVRCGNTVDPNPPKPTPTPSTTKAPTTKTPTTKAPTTKTPTTKTPTTKPNITVPTIPDITLPTIPSTTRPATTKPSTTQPTTKPKEKASDPANSQPGNVDGGKVKTRDDPGPGTTEARMTVPTSVRTVETTTKPATTKPTTTKPATTKPATTNPTTTKPTATPTQKPSSYYKDDAGTTTVITPDNTYSGRPVLPD